MSEINNVNLDDANILRKEFGLLNHKKKFWWKPYASLNHFPTTTAYKLQKIQIAALENNLSSVKFQISLINSTMKTLDKLVQNQNFSKDYNDFFSSFLGKINQPYLKWSKLTGNQDYFTPSTQEINNYITSIESYIKILQQVRGQKIIDQSSFNKIKILLNQNNSAINIKHFTALKAQLWEDIATWILSASGFGQVINTGPLLDAASHQFVQDAIGFLTDIKLPRGQYIEIGVNQKGNKGTKSGNKSLKNYLEKMSLSGPGTTLPFGKRNFVKFEIRNFQNLQSLQNLLAAGGYKDTASIRVSAELDKLIDQSGLKGVGIQAKSGIGQEYLNNAKRDLITKQFLTQRSGHLKKINDFVNEYGDKIDLHRSAKTFEAYTNYIFSKHINETTLGKNTFFFNEQGLGTLPDQMRNNNLYFILSPAVDTLENFYNTESFKIHSTSTI